jgi:transcriptional regulator with XRE-family HTH domain
MARWKALPEGLGPAVVQFVVQLRRMKDDSGLSLRQLAFRTGYSASSWERYLGGRTLPPPEAVEALAGVVGADTVRLLVLHEAAADAWRSEQPDGAGALAPGADPAAGPPSTPAPETGAVRREWLRLGAAAAAGAVTATAVVLLAVHPWQGAAVSATARTAAAATPPAVRYTCAYSRRGGLWYAGNSTTVTDEVEVGMSGPDVAELQCLLQRAGISPGGVDGNFGPLTEKAVIDEQLAQHLDIDGQVGPQTWGALRR